MEDKDLTPDELVEKYYYLVKSRARFFYKMYPKGYIEPEDLTGVLSEVLLTCSRKFDASKGVTFTQYTTNCMRTKVLNELKMLKRKMRIPVELIGSMDNITIEDGEELTMHERLPDNKEIDFVEEMCDKDALIHAMARIKKPEHLHMMNAIMNGYTIREYARLMGKPNNAYIYAISYVLQDLLKKYYDRESKVIRGVHGIVQ